jgi:hypothetical protein
MNLGLFRFAVVPVHDGRLSSRQYQRSCGAAQAHACERRTVNLYRLQRRCRHDRLKEHDLPWPRRTPPSAVGLCALAVCRAAVRDRLHAGAVAAAENLCRHMTSCARAHLPPSTWLGVGRRATCDTAYLDLGISCS